MTEHGNRSVMLEQDWLIRMRAIRGNDAVSLADLTPSDLESLRYQSAVHVSDPALKLLQARHVSAVSKKQCDERPALPPIVEPQQKGWKAWLERLVRKTNRKG
jgi:hypothetical protein